VKLDFLGDRAYIGGHLERPVSMPFFPRDLLPLPWRSWVSGTARSAGAPVDYVAQSLLAVVAGLCGAGALVRITPGCSEPLVLWQPLVGRSSSGKSPAPASLRALLGRLTAGGILSFVVQQGPRQAGRCKRWQVNPARLKSTAGNAGNHREFPTP
jgi:hypothetical protein